MLNSLPTLEIRPEFHKLGVGTLAREGANKRACVCAIVPPSLWVVTFLARCQPLPASLSPAVLPPRWSRSPLGAASRPYYRRHCSVLRSAHGSACCPVPLPWAPHGVDAVVKMLLSRASQPKALRRRPFSGSTLASLAEAYCKVTNSGDTPAAASIWQLGRTEAIHKRHLVTQW